MITGCGILFILCATLILARGLSLSDSNTTSRDAHNTNLKESEPMYKNPNIPVDERVEDLISRMTLDEKIAQVMGIWSEKKQLILNEDGSFNEQKASRNMPRGIGQIGRPSEGYDRDLMQNRTAREMAEFTNAVQRYFIEKTRLGIPVVFHEECLHGHAAKDGTSFPQPIALAGTWDEDLIQRLFSMTALEARSRGAHQALTPVVDVCREPRWGRVEETYGEDPYLVSRIGVAAVKGFQGEGPGIDKGHVIATLKHMTGHGQPESGMNIGPANYSERIIREIFLPPFKACVQEAGALSVMASYNEIDGVPSHVNRWMLTDVLRDEWGFKGYVVSDYYGIQELYTRHKVAKDKREAAKRAFYAGVDIELPDMDSYPEIKGLVESGELTMEILDMAVRRLLRPKFLLGLFEDPYVDPNKAETVVGSKENAKLALEAARKSITLLKNEGNLLPLDASRYEKISVIGPNADQVLLGGYSDVPPYFVTVLEGIKKQVGGDKVLYAEGCRITEKGSWYLDPVVLPDPEEDERRIREAVEVAGKADIVILVLGGNDLTSREAWGTGEHLGDRASLELVGNQNELTRRILALGKPVVVALFNGRPLAINYLNEKVPAILECWYLGQETGNALADVIFGDINPSGRLPISFARSAGHLPVFYNYKPAARRGYLFDDVSPLFAFGYGLSYTTFEYSNVRLAKSRIGISETTMVSVDV
ncbi:MAG: glycoside hydrolase family 3 C-terminal domain-containing protein, partial [Deltaproteobacteria bacterium]|nr:glycoside hydrolase family 3 C-terminal domain-containing protein [Deltaproteobacteria bacterium]